MNTRIRQAFVAVAFSAVAAAAITGATTLRGETKEAATVAEACRVYDWPKIPAECLDGAKNVEVRYVAADATNGDFRPTMN